MVFHFSSMIPRNDNVIFFNNNCIHMKCRLSHFGRCKHTFRSNVNKIQYGNKREHLNKQTYYIFIAVRFANVLPLEENSCNQ